MIIGFRKTSWRHLTHRDWKGDLSLNCVHIGYPVQGYICKAF